MAQIKYSRYLYWICRPVSKVLSVLHLHILPPINSQSMVPVFPNNFATAYMASFTPLDCVTAPLKYLPVPENVTLRRTFITFARDWSLLVVDPPSKVVC